MTQVYRPGIYGHTRPRCIWRAREGRIDRQWGEYTHAIVDTAGNFYYGTGKYPTYVDVYYSPEYVRIIPRGEAIGPIGALREGVGAGRVGGVGSTR